MGAPGRPAMNLLQINPVLTVFMGVAVTIIIACSSDDPTSGEARCPDSGIDQSFVPGDAPGPENGGGAVLVARQMPMAQTFIPEVSALVGVDVYLRTMNPGTGPDEITANISEGTPAGRTIVTVTAQIADGASGLVHLEFDESARVAPGSPYALELQATRPTHAWVLSHEPHNLYESGNAIFAGLEKMDTDMWFTTYCGRAKVSGGQ